MSLAASIAIPLPSPSKRVVRAYIRSGSSLLTVRLTLSPDGRSVRMDTLEGHETARNVTGWNYRGETVISYAPVAFAATLAFWGYGVTFTAPE